MNKLDASHFRRWKRLIIGNLEALWRLIWIKMDRERESHVVPAIVAVVGVVAFAILVYLLLAGADWLINRLFGLSTGTNI